jgi:hypothetical protein
MKRLLDDEAVNRSMNGLTPWTFNDDEPLVVCETKESLTTFKNEVYS